jgi:two-component sensor histidine kinase
MTRGASPARFPASSLRTRLILLLTIALLPIGAVAVYETAELVDETRQLEERDVLARTVRAAGELEAVLQRAYGAAEALGTAAYQQGADGAACREMMRRFAEASLDYVFAGFIEADGVMTCTSSGETIDYTGTRDWQDFSADPRPIARVSPHGDASRQPVLVVFVPILDAETGELLGGQAVSVPQWLTEALLEAGIEDVEVALLDPDGEVLAASTGMERIEAFERAALQPRRMAIPERGRLVEAPQGTGDTHPVALVPLIEDRIYVAGLWDGAAQPRALSLLNGGVAPVFPVLMWIASLVVAFLAVNGLVLRHLRRLSRHMSRFRSDDDGHHFRVRPEAPTEIRSIADSYNAMVDRIAADRNTLTENVREKELLLREVHHRVKNNLQLIASILNMQVRAVRAPDARRILTRVQDRVMSLSTIHKALYSGSSVDSVEADGVLNEVVSGVLNVALPAAAPVEISVELDPVRLDPDQAVPLSLLATEAVTNAAKHLGTPEDGPPRIDVRLSQTSCGQVRFEVVNTRGAPLNVEDMVDGSSLGARLIEAFASQLSGELEVRETGTEYRISVAFARLDPEAGAG